MTLLPSNKSQAFIPKEYRPIGWLRIISLVAFALAFCVISITVYFVYSNVYSIVGSVDAILTLQSDLKIEPIDFTRLDRVSAAWNQKHASTTIVLPRDPFHATSTSTAAVASPGVSVQQ